MRSRLVAALLSALLLTSLVAAQSAPDKKPTLAARLEGLEAHDGFLTWYWDQAKGEFLLQLSHTAMEREFLYFTGFGSGIGSTELFADRGTIGHGALCRFQRSGPRVLVIEENTAFRATDGNAELKHSVEFSFPVSVIAALPVVAEQDGTLLVNANPLVLRDAVDVLGQLQRPTRAVGGQLVREVAAGTASWHLDEARSTVDLEHTRSFPLNTEVEALLTFATDGEQDLNQPNPHALTLREHHSFTALPAAGYQPRERDVRVGFFGVTFEDFAQPFDRQLSRTVIDRWRLRKKNPDAVVSEPVEPITFYLDRAMPEPVRSAARRGALWWNLAFEQAGFKNALRIEDLPEGADPLDVRYPTIQWTNRSGRGWSVGTVQSDPRTGEILHAVVQLDSHRFRTAGNLWHAMVPSGRGGTEAGLDAFAGFDLLDPELDAEQVMLNRMALLTCHEMGHVLGLDHNFVASTFGRGSVMDYFAPRVKLRADGSADLSDAYMQGTGSYDRFAIEWGYSEGAPSASWEQEHTRLHGIVSKAIAAGITWGNYDDPRWNAYDDGPDPVTWLRETLPVRDALLSRYGAHLLRPDEPASLLASRFALVYLFHRYALAAAINTIGSAKVPLSLAGDGQKPLLPWPPESQREALRLALGALRPEKLQIAPDLWRQLVPRENSENDPERFPSSAGYLFSPQDAARAVSDVVLGGLLDASRMARLKVMEAEVPDAVTAREVITNLVQAVFFNANRNAGERELAAVVQTEAAERLMLLAANREATPEVQAAALAGVRQARAALRTQAVAGSSTQRLQDEIDRFLRDPRQNAPHPRGSNAPAGPPT